MTSSSPCCAEVEAVLFEFIALAMFLRALSRRESRYSVVISSSESDAESEEEDEDDDASESDSPSDSALTLEEDTLVFWREEDGSAFLFPLEVDVPAISRSSVQKTKAMRQPKPVGNKKTCSWATVKKMPTRCRPKYFPRLCYSGYSHWPPNVELLVNCDVVIRELVSIDILDSVLTSLLWELCANS